jgi:hypothetical protein
MAQDIGAHAQQITARQESHDLAVAAAEDRDPADIGGSHSVGEATDQLIVVADEQLLIPDPVAQGLAGGPPVMVKRNASARAWKRVPPARGGADRQRSRGSRPTAGRRDSIAVRRAETDAEEERERLFVTIFKGVDEASLGCHETIKPYILHRDRLKSAKSEIEIGIMARWRRARDVVAEDATEGRSRLDAGIPFLGRFMFVPRHIAEIIERRKMGGGADIGE